MLGFHLNSKFEIPLGSNFTWHRRVGEDEIDTSQTYLTAYGSLRFRLVHAKRKMEGEERGVVGVCRSRSVFLGFCREGKERASVGETRGETRWGCWRFSVFRVISGELWVSVFFLGIR